MGNMRPQYDKNLFFNEIQSISSHSIFFIFPSAFYSNNMIFKQITNSIRSLPLSLRACFGSAPHKNPKQSHQDPVQITKFNPLGEKDLRGFEHFSKLSEIQKEYSPIHSEEYRRYSAYGIFSLLSNSVARFIGRLVSHPKSAIASDCLYLPRIYQDSIPIYDSIGKASTYMTVNKITFKIAPLNILFFVPEPGFSLFAYALLCYVYNGTNWKTAKDLVVKMEYLPHTEEFAYQKVSFWGNLVTKKVKKNDLQHATLSEIFGENSYSQKSVRGLYNRQVAYRIKASKELLLFDKHGIWNSQSINHEQLV